MLKCLNKDVILVKTNFLTIFIIDTMNIILPIQVYIL